MIREQRECFCPLFRKAMTGHDIYLSDTQDLPASTACRSARSSRALHGARRCLPPRALPPPLAWFGLGFRV